MQQALVSMTGLAIISTGVWSDGKTGAPLTVDAFSTGLPGTWGGLIVSVGIIMFAYSTILGWATRLRNPNALRRKGMRACQAFHYPQKMGFLPYARTIFEAQAAFLPHATNI